MQELVKNSQILRERAQTIKHLFSKIFKELVKELQELVSYNVTMIAV